MAPARNLSPLNRPPQPALDRGRVQKRIRRAYVATGKLVLSTSELMRWTHPRAGGNRHNHRRAIRGAAERYCVRVGRVSGLGRPILAVVAPARNLSPLNRPPQPALDRGRVQKRIRRAYVATGKLVLSTSELMRWTHPRAGGNRHNHRR